MLTIETKYLLSMGGNSILYFGFYIVILIKVNNTQWQYMYDQLLQQVWNIIFVHQNMIIGDSFICSLSSWVYWHLGWMSVGVSGMGKIHMIYKSGPWFNIKT